LLLLQQQYYCQCALRVAQATQAGDQLACPRY
jgi:hypothetical protein